MIISVYAAFTKVEAKEFRMFQTSFYGRAPHVLVPDWPTQHQVAILAAGTVTPVIALFPHQRGPFLNAPMPLSQVHLFMMLFTEMLFAYIELLCSVQRRFLSPRPALQVDYSPATCNSVEWHPVCSVQFPGLSVMAVSTKNTCFWS